MVMHNKLPQKNTLQLYLNTSNEFRHVPSFALASSTTSKPLSEPGSARGKGQGAYLHDGAIEFAMVQVFQRLNQMTAHYRSYPTFHMRPQRGNSEKLTYTHMADDGDNDRKLGTVQRHLLLLEPRRIQSDICAILLLQAAL
ncbi:hypothetical protein DSUL_90076 [Desulfovibrionales bacterium]